MKSRAFLSLALSLSLGLCATLMAPLAAQAQADFPNKPVSLVTPFPAGSGPDAVLRIVSEKLSKIWNQPVTVSTAPAVTDLWQWTPPNAPHPMATLYCSLTANT